MPAVNQQEIKMATIEQNRAAFENRGDRAMRLLSEESKTIQRLLTDVKVIVRVEKDSNLTTEVEGLAQQLENLRKKLEEIK